MRKFPIVEIEDVSEAFCGVRRKNMVALSDAEPEIAEEWCYEKNMGWGPEHFSHGSGVRCFWICRFCDRVYKAQISNRTAVANRSACPYCASKKVCDDNALIELYPVVAAEWHPKKNGKTKVTDVLKASKKTYWWLCSKCKHSWKTDVASRTTGGSGCPACYQAWLEYVRLHPQRKEREREVLGPESEKSNRCINNRVFVSLAKASPKVAKQWHPTKNGARTAKDIADGSDATVWWQCNKGPDHEWQAAVHSRTRGSKTGCPFCVGRKVSVTNSLKKNFPKLAKEWHSELNMDLAVEDAIFTSTRKVWWLCRRDDSHEWEAAIERRVKGAKCPFCAKKKLSADYCLTSEYPHIAAELHPTKNGDLTGEQIAPYSCKKVWWVCSVSPEHEWLATPSNRVGNGSNCPVCVGKRVSEANSLVLLYPHIAKQWDKKKNGNLKVSDVSVKSKKLVWWRCSKGHSWQQPVSKRTATARECRFCR